MTISSCYSHLNGLEWLVYHKPHLWDELCSVLSQVDAGTCRTKVSKEIGMVDKLLFSPIAMNERIKELLTAKGWGERRVSYWVTDDERLIRSTMHLGTDVQKREILAAGKVPIRSYNQTDFLKERVAIEVQFGKYSFIAYDLFVKHLAFYVQDEIDLGIEILPMKVLQAEMSSGPGHFEGGLYDVIRQGRGVPAVPLILVGVEP